MTPFDVLDEQFAREFGGLPQITPPLPPGFPISAARVLWNADGLRVELIDPADMYLTDTDHNREAVDGLCVEENDDGQ